MKKLLCLGYSGSELGVEYWEQLREVFDEVVFAKNGEFSGHEDADAVFLKLGATFTSEDIDNIPNLKYISILGTGYGGIDVEYAKTKSIAVTNIADYATQSVSEFTFAIILEHLRDISRARKVAGVGSYSEDGFSATEISGKKFGVFGLGAIGKRTAELAKAFGAEVGYWSANSREDLYSYADIKKVCSESDIISINIAYNSETEGILSSELIESFKPGAIVVNTSPMELIDLDALVSRLEKGDITFIFDHADEMSEADVKRLVKYENCIVYPPIGYITEEASAAKQQVFVDNVTSFMNGESLNRVD